MVGAAGVRRRKVGGLSEPRLRRGDREEALRAHHQGGGGGPGLRRPRNPRPRLHRPSVHGDAARCSTGKATPPKKTEPFFGSPPCRSPRRSAGRWYRWAAPPRTGGNRLVRCRRPKSRTATRGQEPKRGPRRPASRTAGAGVRGMPGARSGRIAATASRPGEGKGIPPQTLTR